MRRCWILLALALVPSAGMAAAERVPVLVELFTSEGCSSCPPADALLARLVAEQPVDGIEVVALAWHVDYWNDLGWTDPFTTPGATERQREYSRSFGLRGAYTPQLVIDGGAELVGSDGPAALEALRSAAARAHAPLSLHVVAATVGRPVDTARFRIECAELARAGPAEPSDVVLAIVEDRLEADVHDGENAGRRLRHEAVVREARVVAATERDGTALRIETGDLLLRSRWNRNRLRAVAFVQERKSRRVLAATQVPIPAAVAPETAR